MSQKPKNQRRRASTTTEEQMLDLHDHPLFGPIYGIDLSQDTRMLELHSRLVKIEDRIRFIVEIPVSMMKFATHQLQTVVLDKLPPALREKIEQAVRGELGRKRRLRRAN